MKKNSNKVKVIIHLLIVMALAYQVYVLTNNLFAYAYQSYTVHSIQSNEFRQMRLDNITMDTIIKLSDEYNVDRGYICAVIFATGNVPQSKNQLISTYNNLLKQYPQDFNNQFIIYKSIIADLSENAFFPVAASTIRNGFVNYVDSWGNKREYGGDRIHEGTDIMSDENKSGVMPIVAVCSGKVTNAGWLKLGGYRVGITSCNNIYYYYAHLESIIVNEGDYVEAGQIIGYMGDTGYSEIEGTRGMFPVHLHFGMYYVGGNQELSINPYWYLNYLRNKILYYNC